MSSFEDLGIKAISGKVRFASACPNCDSTRKHKGRPSLTVNNEPDNRWYKCWNCNFSGNLDLVDKYAKVLEKSRMPKQLAETYSKEVREYLERRGIDQRTALKEKIYEYSTRTAEGSKPIMGFPFYINLTLVNVKFFDVRWKPGSEYAKWRQMPRETGSRSIFLGMQSLSFDEDDKKEIIITEGEWDWPTWKQCGYKNVVSVPQGAPSANAKDFDKEFEYANDKYVQSVFAQAERIIFSTDNDAPGRLLRNQLALIFGKEKCKYVNYPIGYKDANDVLVGVNKEDNKLPALGKAGIDEMYGNLSSFPIAGIIRPMDVKDELEVYAKIGFTKGLGIGIEKVDRLYTEKPKRLQVITGLPGSGKSSFARWHTTELIRHNGNQDLKFGLFTPENRPVSREYVKIAEVMTGQYFREGWGNSMSKTVRDKTLWFIQKHFFVISPDRRNFDPFNGKIKADKVNTMASLCEYLVYLKKTENIFGYIIDAWNKIEHEQPKNMTETSYISSQLDHLIDFNDYYDLHGIIVAHPTKVEKVGINYRMPCLYDIKGSSAWKEKSDIGIIVHRNMNRKRPADEIPTNADEDDKYYVDANAPTIIRTEKIRFEEEGLCDRIKLRMDYKKGGRFFLYDEDEKPAPEPVKGALNPPKGQKDDDDVFNGHNNGGKDDLPF